jgi:hypothetical protein
MAGGTDGSRIGLSQLDVWLGESETIRNRASSIGPQPDVSTVHRCGELMPEWVNIRSVKDPRSTNSRLTVVEEDSMAAPAQVKTSLAGGSIST